ncbi:hypothetical protein AB0I72_20445 [Nocardiopsis sp. NPDC049922]|uniref:hypothetical protein n=1 Tax=Nocardiopsis sp. NPDC049922 TaxID=3155157 RepID=UPI0033F3983E
MSQVLLYVTPATVALATAAGALLAVLCAWWRSRRPGVARVCLRGVLAAATLVYVLVLAMPIGVWDGLAGPTSDERWEPWSVLRESWAGAPHAPWAVQAGEGRSITLTTGEHAFYTREAPTPEDIRAVGGGRGEVAPMRGTGLRLEDLDYFAYPGGWGAVVVLGVGGEGVEPEAATEVADQARPLPGQVAVLAVDTADEPERRGLADLWDDVRLDLQTPGEVTEATILDTLLYVPVGTVAFLAFSSWAPRYLYGPVLSVGIELLRPVLSVERIPDAGDLLAHLLGSALGVGLAAAALLLFRRGGGSVAIRRPRT